MFVVALSDPTISGIEMQDTKTTLRPDLWFWMNSDLPKNNSAIISPKTNKIKIALMPL
jgi:hypothetical protein